MVTEKPRSGTLPGQGRLFPPETQRPCSPSLPAAPSQAQLEPGGVPGPQVCWRERSPGFGGWMGALGWEGGQLPEPGHLEFPGDRGGGGGLSEHPFPYAPPPQLPSWIYCPCYLAPGPAFGQGELKGGTLGLLGGGGYGMARA